MYNVFWEELFYILSLSLLSLIIHYFYCHCFECILNSKRKILALYVLYYGVCVGLRFTPLPGVMMLTINIGLIFLLSYLYKGKLLWRICASLFLMAVILLSDMVFAASYSTIGYVINLFLSKLLMLIIVLIFIRITKSFGDGSLSVIYWFLLLCCPILSFVGMFQLIQLGYIRSNPILLPIASSGLLIINFLIFILCDQVLSIKASQNKSHLLQEQNAYYINQYLLTKERQDESFKFQHDFKNMLIGLKTKIETDKKDTGIIAINKLIGNFDHSANLCNSGNILIDSIINYKQQVALKHNIPFTYKLSIPPHLNLDEMSISVILGNLLDNAIDASLVKGNEQCHIELNMQYLNESIFLKIQNSYVNEIRCNSKGDFYTTKPDKNKHGIGLKNIRRIVEDCNGLLDISYDNNLFQIQIVLFNIAREDQYNLL